MAEWSILVTDSRIIAHSIGNSEGHEMHYVLKFNYFYNKFNISYEGRG